MSSRYAIHFILLLTILATIPYLGVNGQDSALVRRYAMGTAVTAAHRQSTAAEEIYLVRFPNYPGSRVLSALGVIKSPSPQFHIVRKMPADTTVTVWIANNNWKASPKLLDKLELLRPADSITLFANTSVEGPFHILAHPAVNVYEVRLAKKDWPEFTMAPQIHAADVSRVPRTEATVANSDLRVNRLSTLHANIPALRGNGMRISLKESLYDTTDIDLRTRYIPTAAAPDRVDAHATLMATLIAGNGNSGPQGMGAAPLAGIASSDFTRLLPDANTSFTTYGLQAQNHSYGTGIENYYGLEAAAYDAQLFEMDTFLHVFSSGNIGTDAPGEGIYAGIAAFANLSGTFKQAKNVLVAGATDGSSNIALLSSRGPCYDGRIKPELVVYGPGGTSDAAALLSGIGLLVREQSRLQTGEALPTALAAAVLINSATDVGAPGPDFTSGFGAANAWEAVKTIMERRYVMSAVQQGSSYTVGITVPPNTHSLKITLRYTDLPAAANSAQALVNDLDLWVTDAAGRRYDPLTLSAFPHRDSLSRHALPGRDSLNNTEQVVLHLPAAGDYTVHAEGHRVMGTQRFALAWQLTAAGAFGWDNPAASATLDAGVQHTLRWSTTISGPGKIYYRPGTGNWQLVANVTDVAEEKAEWAAPPAFGLAQLRMEAGGKMFDSPLFLLAPRVKPATGFICEDSALVWWPPATGAAAYRIYRLNGDAYVLFAETRDTFFAFRPSAVPSGIIAVSAVGDVEGPRSEGHLFSAGAPGCYIRNFTADLEASGEVRLQLELGTAVGLKAIRWVRQGAGLGSATSANSLYYSAIDAQPPQGIVYYHAEVELQNGRIIVSDAVPVQVTGAAGFIVFPNPASGKIMLMSKALRGQRIVITDMQGRICRILQQEALLQEISLHGLPAGTYWLGVYENGSRMFHTRFVKVQ